MNPDPGSEHSSIRMKLPPHSWISCSSSLLQNMNSVIVDPDHIDMDPLLDLEFKKHLDLDFSTSSR